MIAPVDQIFITLKQSVVSSFPEQVLYTINVATRQTVIETLVVLPVIVGLATGARWDGLSRWVAVRT